LRFILIYQCDLASLIFVLSAIHPEKHVIALKNIAAILKPNGKVIFRDYAENDHAMLRFKPGTKVDINYFILAVVQRLFFILLSEMNLERFV
jgi:methyltransferase-like protein 6